MEDLPDEILLIILEEHLHVRELARCRLLSKRFKVLVDNFVRIKKFVFENMECTDFIYAYSGMCDTTIKPIKRKPPNPNHFIRLFRRLNRFDLPSDSSFQTVCCKLRSLVLSVDFPFSESNEAALNKLVELEELYIRTVDIYERETPAQINLPNLELLSINHFTAVQIGLSAKLVMPKTKLVVNSKIKQLVYDELGFFRNFELLLDLKHPEHVRFLKIVNMETENLSSFQNLRVLHCEKISKSNYCKIVETLPDLEEISFVTCYTHLLVTKHKIAKMANYLNHQKALFGREKLKIYYFGILLNKPFEEYDFNIDSGNIVLKHLNFYDQLAEHLPFLVSVDNYGELVVGLQNLAATKKLILDLHGLPVRFFERTCIQHIELRSRIENTDQFCSFLKQCKWVRELRFDEGAAFHLEQCILDLIANLYALSLTKLSVFGANSRLDFRPIFKMQLLIELKIKPINLDSEDEFQELLVNFRNLKYFLAGCRKKDYKFERFRK